MYAHLRSPTLSRYRRRSSSNTRILNSDDHYHHCRCCSMSTSDLMHHHADHAGPDKDPDWNEEVYQKKSTRTPSIVSTLSSPNILLLANEYQQNHTHTVHHSDQGNRLRERLAASVAGLKELDILREKHKRMVEDVKAHLKISNSEMIHQGYSTTGTASNAARSPSPAELSSNISHRSSLSMDSGVCLSLTSDHRPMISPYFPNHGHHQRRLSTDSVNGYHSYLSPTRKTSWTMSSANALYDSNATVSPTSDDEGCPSTDSPRTYNSLASITAALAAAEATVALPRSNLTSFRYRRRLDPGSTPNRPRSLYNSYPDENTVLVEPPVSPQYVQNSSMNSNMRLLRRTSVQYRPQIPTIVANLPDSKTNDHCWDSVVSRRRSGRGSSAVDPVFRASRVFIDTLPENEVLLAAVQTDSNHVSLRPRRYETRRPRPTSVAVPLSVSTPMLQNACQSSGSNQLKRQNSSDLDHLADWARSSSSSTLVRQHSTASVTSNGHSAVTNGHSRRRASKSPKPSNASMVNVSVVTTGDTTSSGSSSCGTSSDQCADTLINGIHVISNGSDDHVLISRSISSQSSDSIKSKRNKEKTWRESPDL